MIWQDFYSKQLKYILSVGLCVPSNLWPWCWSCHYLPDNLQKHGFKCDIEKPAVAFSDDSFLKHCTSSWKATLCIDLFVLYRHDWFIHFIISLKSESVSHQHVSDLWVCLAFSFLLYTVGYLEECQMKTWPQNIYLY